MKGFLLIVFTINPSDIRGSIASMSSSMKLYYGCVLFCKILAFYLRVSRSCATRLNLQVSPLSHELFSHWWNWFTSAFLLRRNNCQYKWFWLQLSSIFVTPHFFSYLNFTLDFMAIVSTSRLFLIFYVNFLAYLWALFDTKCCGVLPRKSLC